MLTNTVKKNIKIFVVTTLFLLALIAIILPSQGKFRYDVRWRAKNLKAWHKIVVEYAQVNNHFPMDLYDVYVSSYKALINTDFSIYTNCSMSGGLDEVLKNNKVQFMKDCNYEHIVFDKEHWIIIEKSKISGGNPYILFVNQDGDIWKARRY